MPGSGAGLGFNESLSEECAGCRKRTPDTEISLGEHAPLRHQS